MHLLLYVRRPRSAVGILFGYRFIDRPLSLQLCIALLLHKAAKATAFTALAWITTLQWSVQSLPGIYNTVANLKPSLTRIDDFLTTPITELSTPYGAPAPNGALPSSVELRPMAQLAQAQHRSMDSRDSWRSEPWLDEHRPCQAP